jgi:hypothetical protein
MGRLLSESRHSTYQTFNPDLEMPAQLPFRRSSTPQHFEAMARRDLSGRWQEVLAIETLLDEISDEFEGEDLALPEIREWPGRGRARSMITTGPYFEIQADNPEFGILDGLAELGRRHAPKVFVPPRALAKMLQTVQSGQLTTKCP